jgi:hypothetical protein
MNRAASDLVFLRLMHMVRRMLRLAAATPLRDRIDEVGKWPSRRSIHGRLS